MKHSISIAVLGFLLAIELATGQARAGVPDGETALQTGADAIHALGVPGVLIEAVVDAEADGGAQRCPPSFRPTRRWRQTLTSTLPVTPRSLSPPG